MAALFRALGAPVGDKVKNGTDDPALVGRGPLEAQREFLAAYLGGDATVPRIVGRNLVSQSSVGFHRVVENKESGLEFADQLVLCSPSSASSRTRSNADPVTDARMESITLEIRLRFKLSEDNILRLCHVIGVRYCSRKALSSEHDRRVSSNQVSDTP